jgi:hypothetical protein
MWLDDFRNGITSGFGAIRPQSEVVNPTFENPRVGGSIPSPATM